MSARRRRWHVTGGLGACALVFVALAGCSADSTSTAGTSAGSSASKSPQRLLVLGSDLTIGNGLDDPLREAWPYLYFAQAFPGGTQFVNAATDHATVTDARREQAPLVGELSPDVVAIALGTDDVSSATPVDTFETDLGLLVQGVKSAGVTVLVAEIPLIGYDAATLAPYNAAIDRVAQAAGVTLVKLGTTNVSTSPAHPIDPDPAGQATIAREFVEATKRAVPSS